MTFTRAQRIQLEREPDRLRAVIREVLKIDALTLRSWIEDHRSITLPQVLRDEGADSFDYKLQLVADRVMQEELDRLLKEKTNAKG